MSLNISKGNMYDFVTHTWNTVKGECAHNCAYCYMKKWGNQKPVHFDESELKTDLGSGNFIFVGSSCDLFSASHPYEWIIKTVKHCAKFDNKYLFQSKNPKYFDAVAIYDVPEFVLCTTLETNRVYPEVMGSAPDPVTRAWDFAHIPIEEKYITIEPIMDFDLYSLASMIRYCYPIQVNIGANTGSVPVPEPSKEKILALIDEIEPFTTVKLKSNLKRLLK